MKVQNLLLLTVSLLFGFTLSTSNAANAPAIFSTSATSYSGEFDLSVGANYSPTIVPTAATTRDVEFSGNYGNTTFTVDGSALAFGTLDDIDTNQSLIVSNNNATTGSITLSTASNSVSGNSADLLFVKSGANLTVQSETGTLNLDVAATGNIDNAGTLNITAPLVISNAFTYTLSFTGAGATTVSGGISGSSGRLTVNDAGGSLTLGGTNTYGGVTTVNAGTLNLTGEITNNVTVNNGGTLTESSTGGIVLNSGNYSVTVNGGTATLGGTATNNGYHGATTVDGGGTFNLTGNVNSTGTIVLGSSTIGGGTFNYSTVSGGAFTYYQTFGSLTLNPGASVVNDTVGGDSLRLTTITHNVGGTVAFTTTTGGITSTNANTNGILGGYATYGGETTWAVSGASATNPISGLANGSYINNTWAAANNTAVSSSSFSPAANSTTNSLRFNNNNSGNPYTVTLTGSNVITSGGILETSAVGNSATVIGGTGTLAGAAGSDLVVIQNNPTSSMTISAGIADNTSATGLTKSGVGLLTLAGANTYTGATTVNTGSLALATSGSINNTASVTVLGGAAFGAATSNSGALTIATNKPALNLVLGTTMATQSNLQLNLFASGASDTITAGALTLNSVTGVTGGTVLVTLNDTTSNNLSGTYTLVSWTSGTYPLADFTLAGSAFGEGTLSEMGNNLDFNVTAVPEPSAWALVPVAAGLVASGSRLKRLLLGRRSRV